MAEKGGKMPEKILIVDDELDMLRLLEMIIKEKTTYETVGTNNPYEAIELAKQRKFDLVITDLKMPGLDGIEVLEAIRRIDENIPIILITAYATLESAVEIMGKGGFDLITKPFRKEQILFTIDKAIKWVKLQRENKILKERLKNTEG